MKRVLSILFVLSVMLISLPISAQAAGNDTDVVDMHGTKTYLGSMSSWNKTWNALNFKDVTNEDFVETGDLIIKSGTVNNVNVSGDLTVQGGIADDIVCGGTVSIKAGTVNSLKSRGDVSVNGGDISQSIRSINGTVKLSGNINMGCSVTGNGVTFDSGKIQLSGPVKANDVTFSSGSAVSVTGTVGAKNKVKLNNCTISVDSLDGNKTAELDIDNYKNSLPEITDMAAIQLGTNCKTVTDQDIKTGTLSLAEGSMLSAYSTVVTDYLKGPGILCTDAGTLTVNKSVSGIPTLAFLSPVSNGTTIFTSGAGRISPSQVQLMVGTLQQYYSGGVNYYSLKNDASEGLDLDSEGLSLGSGKSGTVKAVISPGIARYATGTKIIWKMYGDTSGFSVSPSSDSLSCNVSAAATGYHKAVLVAYLVDQRGDKLTDYRADSCVLVSGSSDSGLKLDTSTVSVLTGDKYGILAFGGSGSKPAASSSNPSVASLDDGRQTKDKRGNAAWLYTVTGGASGTATIDIGGQKVIVTVNSGILMDTMSFSMSPKAKYCIGVLAKGVSESDFKVYSTSDCINVKVCRRNSGGQILYQVTGVKDGTADVVFEISGGQTVRSHFTVKSGEKSYGRSARLVALKQ